MFNDKPLSERQIKILDFIKRFMAKNQFPPTVRDIQKACEISSTSVVDYNLHILQRRGTIRRLPEVSRGIELLGEHAAGLKNAIKVPIYGNVAAGEPLHIPSAASRHEDEFEFIQVPVEMVNGHSNTYALKVKGDSMIDAFITDGDYVILDRTINPESGDMVAAEIKSEESITLKRFFLEGEEIRLQPENATMKPIMVNAEDINVKGKVIGLLRSF